MNKHTYLLILIAAVIFAACKKDKIEYSNDLLLKRADASISFEAKNSGLISAAGYVPKGCQDDCLVGIRIRSISKYG